MLFVARVAARRFGNERSWTAGSAKAEKGPTALKSLFVFDMNFHPAQVSLKVAGLIDRAFVHRMTQFQNQHCFVRPGSGLQKGSVGGGIHEYIIELRMLGRRSGTIGH